MADLPVPSRVSRSLGHPENVSKSLRGNQHAHMTRLPDGAPKHCSVRDDIECVAGAENCHADHTRGERRGLSGDERLQGGRRVRGGR